MKKITSVLSAALALALLMASSQSYSAIVYQLDNRYTSHTLTYSGTVTPSTSFADFDSSNWAFEAGAFQTSQLTAGTMSGTGSTYAGYDAMYYGAEATSVFDVTFTVDQTSHFVLDGYIDVTGLSQVTVNLFENGVNMFSLSAYDPDVFWYEQSPFEFSSIISEGNTYQLVLYSHTYESEYYDEAWSFDVQVSAVPLPAAAWLFIAGLVSIAGVARQRHRSS